MKICLVGGIYNKGGARSSYLKITPETTLETGFREAGHEVTTLSHYDETDFSKFDVVHVHHLSYGALRMASDMTQTPFVFTPHATSHMAAGSLSRTRRVAMRYVLSSADAVVSLSEMEAQGAREAYSFDGAILTAIANGIDVTKYNYRRANKAGQGAPWQLLFSAQLIPIKRCDVLMRAMASLPYDSELTLVYQNPQIERELMAFAASIGLAKRVHFRGKVDPQELAGLYQTSDLLVLPSETEALPSVITEAMLCGLPFVASAVGGIPEQANGYGVVLEDRSMEKIAEAIAHVFENYGKFQADAPAASEYARKKFAIDTMIQRHLELYEQVLGVSPRRHAAKLALPRGLARLSARWMGTSGPGQPAQSSVTKVA
jgi:glycosyltransferase involved in cell wall biosynthesis